MGTVWKMISYDWGHIPKGAKWMSLTLFLFVFGRGLGGDVFFSVYVDEIVDNALLLSLLGAGLSFIKMILSLAIGDMEEKANFAKILQGGKWIYVVCGLLFAMAGYYSEPLFLYIAILLNGIANPMVYMTYTYYFGKHSDSGNRFAMMGLLESSVYLAYVLGALISALLVQYLDVWILFFFVPLFAIFSMWGWRRLEKEVTEKAKTLTEHLNIRKQMIYDMLAKETYTHPMKIFKDHGLSLLGRLSLVALTKGLDYVGFLFIPVLVVTNELGLMEVALIFAAMRIPPMFSYFVGDIEDRLPYKSVLLVGLGGLALVFIGFSITTHFSFLMALGFIMGTMLTILRPLVNGNVFASVKKTDTGSVSGLLGVFSRVGEIIASLLFGTLSSVLSMQSAFGVFACIVSFVFLVFLLTFKEK